jgi:hypothetical protein
LLQFDVPPVSVRIADTRINRDTKGVRFMREEDLRAVGRWIEGLKGPGVLVVGQPVLVEGDSVANSLLKKGLIKAALSYIDRDLSNYTQFKDLVGHIQSSDHSVVVLTGDVHFGRVACGQLKRGSESTFVEVISSPMHAVLSDKDEPLFGTYKNAPVNDFPISEDREVLRRRNHFVTVRFFLSEDRQVNMEVRAWPIPRPGEEVSPNYDVVFEAVLS